MIILIKGKNPPTISQSTFSGTDDVVETAIYPLGEYSFEILVGRREKEYERITEARDKEFFKRRGGL